jgi:hypothetical protein
MALINDKRITAQIAALANAGTVDTNTLVSLLNQALPAGQQINTSAGGPTVGIYKHFAEFDKVNAKIEVVTTGLWSNDSGSLTHFYTSSIQTTANSGYYYTNVYDMNPLTTDNESVQFAVSWGSYDGSGSMTLQTNDNALYPTLATYFQYRAILLDPTLEKFQFNNSVGIPTDCNEIYVINIARSRFREKMDSGNWSLQLSGSNGEFTFIDNSGKKFSDTAGLSGNVFAVVSGSLELGTQNEATIKNTTDPTTGLGYGAFYPDRGIIVLNAKAVGSLVGNIPTRTIYTPDGVKTIANNLSGSLNNSSEQFNHYRLIPAMELSGDFQARRTENVSTQHFFVRATNREFNYSNNPTYVNANGYFVESTFNTDPYTYITTVGLLNDSNEILAVAKTSQPIPKSFDKEVLIKVKLSF